MEAIYESPTPPTGHLDAFKMAGTVHFLLRDETTGEIKEEWTQPNMMMNVGFAHIASRQKDATAAAMGWIAIGTGGTALAATQTLLVTEIARVASSAPTLVTTTVTNDSIQYVTTFGAGTGTGTLAEAGIFNIATANTAVMLCRTLFSVVKAAGDSLTITWTVKAA